MQENKNFLPFLSKISTSRNNWEKPENRGAERVRARSASLFSDILSTFVKY